MFRFLIRLLLAILTLRVLVGLVRFARGDAPKEPHERAPQPIVDRASAIDVPFTEEPRES